MLPRWSNQWHCYLPLGGKAGRWGSVREINHNWGKTKHTGQPGAEDKTIQAAYKTKYLPRSCLSVVQQHCSGEGRDGIKGWIKGRHGPSLAPDYLPAPALLSQAATPHLNQSSNSLRGCSQYTGTSSICSWVLQRHQTFLSVFSWSTWKQALLRQQAPHNAIKHVLCAHLGSRLHTDGSTQKPVTIQDVPKVKISNIQI